MEPRQAGARSRASGRGLRQALAATATGALVLTMVAGPAALAASAAGAPYTDIGTAASATAITFMTGQGVLNGYPDNTFKPLATITRAEFTTAAVRLLGPTAQAAASALANIPPKFTDATSIPTYAWGFINYAQARNWINGFPDGSFKANADVTLAQAAKILIGVIGDAPVVPATASWPSNYTLAAYTLQLEDGITFSPNLPATRGDVAQMLYNAAVISPTLQNGYVTGTPTGQPLYEGGVGMTQTAWQGVVSAVSTSSISLNTTAGTALLTAPLAASYHLIGASSITAIQGASVLVAEDTSGDVNFVQVQKSVSTGAGTLADASVATPSGYSRMGNWWVSNSGGNWLLLADGSLVQLASPTSGAGTMYYVNPPTSGVSTDPNAQVAGVANLASGDSISTVLNASGQAVTVIATGPTTRLGRVSSVSTSSLVYTTGNNDAAQSTVTVQPWTTVMLNGQASTLSALQANDIIDVQLVGNGNGGDTSAREIDATRKTVSGTITSIQTGGTTTTLGITGTNGVVTSVVEDSSFNPGGAGLQLSTAVTLVLDSNGQARLAIAAVAQQHVVLVEGLQSLTTTNASGQVVVTQEIVADYDGQKVTYNLASNAAAVPTPPANGYLAELTIQPGSGVVSSVSQLSALNVGSNTLRVVTKTGSFLTVMEYNAAGQATGTSYTLDSDQGAVAYSGETYVPFANVPDTQAISNLYISSSGMYIGIRY